MTFSQIGNSRTLKLCDMNEHILCAVLHLNKAVAFCWVKPFYSAILHFNILMIRRLLYEFREEELRVRRRHNVFLSSYADR